MGVARQVFKIREQRSCNPLTPGGGDDGQPLHRQMIGGVLKTNRSDRRVVDPGQDRSTVIQGALDIHEGLTINPRRRVEHPTILGRGCLGDAVNTRLVFTGRNDEANVACSHLPLD
jgi:hypothetical protein